VNVKFLVSAIVNLLWAGLGIEREVSTTWTVEEVPTLRDLERTVDALVQKMVQDYIDNEHATPLEYDTYSFTVTGLFRVQ
jgi:hypothetical protein